VAGELSGFFDTINVLGLSFGYIFVIVIAGCSLIISYYVKKGKLVVRSPFGLPKKDKDKEKQQEKKGEDSLEK